jgi:threonine dehydrogenase-like Zn-dependent dehydrogenase
VRVEQRDDPKIIQPTDVIIGLTATCVCGSDLWDWRGINPVTQPTPMGHEYAGAVEEAGRDVQTVKPGDFVVGTPRIIKGTPDQVVPAGPARLRRGGGGDRRGRPVSPG